LFDLGLRFGGRPTKRAGKFAALNRQALEVVEELLAGQKAAVGLRMVQMPGDKILVNRFSERGEAHKLVLAAFDLETAVIRERRVEQAERVRKLEMLRQLDLVPAPDAHRRRAPLADAVERENGGLVVRARKKRARRVALVVIGENERRFRRV